jgi:hypothetical protein
MWLGALSWTKKISARHNNDNALNGIGKRGANIFVHNKWNFCIKKIGFFQNYRMVSVKLKNLPKRDIGLTNVYAPNNPWEHCTLWNKML